MPNIRWPRRGSMQFWPRKRAKRHYARVRAWANVKETKPLGFAGYKVGMTHIFYTDNTPNSMTKGEDIPCPVTVIECPALKVASIVFYKQDTFGLSAVSQILADKIDKELGRKLSLPKKPGKKIEDIKDFDDVRLLVYTQPKLTNTGRKKPEIFEIALGGKKDEKLAYAKEKLGKEISISDVFKEGEQIDVHGITKGKGFQGPVKRFGVKIRSHKAEKTKRGPGSLGGWKGQGGIMYRVAHAGTMGYHTRTDYNKWLLKISNKADGINPKGGFKRYGVVKSDYALIKGSIFGPPHRIVRLNLATRPNKKIHSEAPAIPYTSLESKQ